MQGLNYVCITNMTLQQQFRVIESFENSCCFRIYVHVHTYIPLNTNLAQQTAVLQRVGTVMVWKVGVMRKLSLKKQEFELRDQVAKSVIIKILSSAILHAAVVSHLAYLLLKKQQKQTRNLLHLQLVNSFKLYKLTQSVFQLPVISKKTFLCIVQL